MRPHPSAFASLALAALLGLASSAHAWPHNTVGGGVPLTNGYIFASNPVSDGAGGVIVAYTRYGNGYDVYAQRYDASGTALWGSGVLVTNATGDQANLMAASDNNGGAFIVWEDGRTNATTGDDIYAQHLSANGSVLWDAGGTAICTATGTQIPSRVTGDRNGGCWIAWDDSRSLGNTNVYLQYLNYFGTTSFAFNGVPVSALPGGTSEASMATTVYGQLVIAWADARSGTSHIYLQIYSPAGSTSLPANGVLLSGTIGGQYNTAVRDMGDGGAVIAWADGRAGDQDIYAQRVFSFGGTMWTAGGIPVCSVAGLQSNPQITVDIQGNPVLYWLDQRTALTTNIYAQRLDASGAALWTTNGIAVRTGIGAASNLFTCADPVGGTIVTWSDSRSDANLDTWAQRLSSSGSLRWSNAQYTGTTVANGPSRQAPLGILPAATGGAFITGQDYSTAVPRLYFVDEWGSLGAEPAMAGVKDIPNDQGGQVKVSWYASPLDTDPLYRNITDYVLYRSVPARLAATLAPELHEGGATIGGRRYLRTRTGAQDYFWEELAHITPRHLASYSYTAPTEGDSVGGSNPRTVFMVMALANSGTSWWTSAPDSGYSVDNLPPTAPAPLTGQYAAGTTRLHWDPNTEADVAGYRIYRGTTAGFAVGAGTLLAAVPDTGFADAAAAPYFYKVTAIDSHGNESAPAALQPAGTLGVDDAPLRTAFAAPAPNPLRAGGAMTLRFTLAQAGRVRLALHDAQGRLVRVLADGVQSAGAHAAAFDGRDANGRALAPGLYLARFEAAGFTRAQRVVILD